jgi:hypothetical protein
MPLCPMSSEPEKRGAPEDEAQLYAPREDLREQ